VFDLQNKVDRLSISPDAEFLGISLKAIAFNSSGKSKPSMKARVIRDFAPEQ
jgi:hypothetical protein